jgi:hypothetical protein
MWLSVLEIVWTRCMNCGPCSDDENTVRWRQAREQIKCSRPRHRGSGSEIGLASSSL